MYRLGKRVISQFIRTGCRRRLRLDLYAGATDREREGAPNKDARRPGLALLVQQGREYEQAKFQELEEVFGALVVRGPLRNTGDQQRTFDAIELADVLDTANAFTYLLEAQFEVTNGFISAHRLGDLVVGLGAAGGHELTFAELRPDILQVLPANGDVRRVVEPDGGLLRIGPEDDRLGLRVIDIKIAGEPSASHFAELAYYGMALAAWLQDTGRKQRFVVLADCAIWPGSHVGSVIRRLLEEDRKNGVGSLDLERYLDGLENDLEVMPPEVVLGRIQRFLSVDLREVLAEPDWRTLPWHIDHTCLGCDYLGYRWSLYDETASEQDRAPADVRYCWPMAERAGHLSRVAGLTEGACGKLREADVCDVAAVAGLNPGNVAFEGHQVLRAKRTVLSARAASLNGNTPADIPNRAGTSATLPRFADIRVGVSADFDIGSGLTFAFGYRLDYGVPTAAEPAGTSDRRYSRKAHYKERPLLVLERSLDAEGETLELWLGHLVADIELVRAEVIAGYRLAGNSSYSDATVQFFPWDRLTFNHLCRVFGRHLHRVHAIDANREINPIAWVFPAEKVLEDPHFVSQSSPVTIVADAVNNLMAAPIAHHYGVVELANHLDPESHRLADGTRWEYRVNRFYRDPLSDQIPSERGHEIWERSTPFKDRDYQWHQEEVRKVVRTKLRAILYVAEQLTRLLREDLVAEAPRVDAVLRQTTRLSSVADDGQIVYQHARLMAAAQRLEVELLMAMPPHEREARFHSARVEAVLQATERHQTLEGLGIGHRSGDASVLALRLSNRSREARLKEGEFTWSFVPEADLPGLQHLSTAQFKRRHPDLEDLTEVKPWEWHQDVRSALTVTILKIDRSRRLLVVEAQRLLQQTLQLDLLQMDLEGSQGHFGILDPIAMDVFTRKLRATLEEPSGIRNPGLARQRPLFPTLSITRLRTANPRVRRPPRPADEFIWEADRLADTDTGLSAGPLLTLAGEAMPEITQRQREAIERAYTRRLALWWGPPGTGKSRTAQAYITALAANAVKARQVLRVAVTGFTWVAIDNVARQLPALFEAQGIAQEVELLRLCSGPGSTSVDPLLRDHALPMDDRSAPRRAELEGRLGRAEGVTIVATTVDQMYKLCESKRCAKLFDVLLIDEASQLDVAHALVALSKLANDARVVVVGDDMQMAPIHPIEPPEGLDHLLGSVYDFFRRYRQGENQQAGVEPVMLNRSFRSNREIVAFVREAGYGADLQAAEGNAELRVRTTRPIPTSTPPGWPEDLPFSPDLARILNPADPVVAVVHADRYSSQRNDGEASLVAGLVLSLYHAGLAEPRASDNDQFDHDHFFRKGVGVVTPHRAQQAAVYDRLAGGLPGEVDRSAVFDSVDTVERFQGQERTVMIASFGLGDADQIAAEEDFIFSLNRFNVIASRAQAKFIAILSRQLVDFLPRDRRVLDESRLLKHFVYGFLRRSESIDLPILGTCELKTR